MLRLNPKLILLSCILITLLAIVLKYLYQSFSYFNSVMLLAIMLTAGLRNFYTRFFGLIGLAMVAVSIFTSLSSLNLIMPQVLMGVVMVATIMGVLFIKRIYASFQQEKRQMNILISQRKEAEENLILKKEELERITTDIRRLNASLENKVEERTLILKEALQELEKSQIELNEALNKEKELNDIKSRFVSMASHEFRTPLSTILSSASLLGRYTLTEDQDKREKHLLRIKDSVKHLNGLLGDFLSLGKLEEGKITVIPSEFNARDFIQEICDEMKPMLKRGQQIEHAYRGEACFCSDKRLLKNILINLLNNAIKFSPPGEAIWISVYHQDDRMFIEVSDRGIGIPEEDKQHLFTTFFRGKNATNIEGTGLGLNIVKRYTDLVQGTISVVSEIGKGTSIHLNLPVLVTQAYT